MELAAELVEFGLQPGDLLLSLFQRGAKLSALRTGRPRGRRGIAHTLITIRTTATIACVFARPRPDRASFMPQGGLNGYI